jgi:hypothetical protein
MNNELLDLIIRDLLWLLIIAGWLFLILTGLEADKPLSGGIPGHADAAKERLAPTETVWDRLGEQGAWLVFGLVTASLPLVLWWIFTVHPR